MITVRSIGSSLLEVSHDEVQHIAREGTVQRLEQNCALSAHRHLSATPKRRAYWLSGKSEPAERFRRAVRSTFLQIERSPMKLLESVPKVVALSDANNSLVQGIYVCGRTCLEAGQEIEARNSVSQSGFAFSPSLPRCQMLFDPLD